jgi:photosystem II stability/assembly factor-like uncharacterized protein
MKGPEFLGHILHHVVLDPRGGRTMLAAAKTGHLGPTVFRSVNNGRTWKEAEKPPAFTKTDGGEGLAVEHVFWLTPGHRSEPGVWWAGTSPPGLFRSEDDGRTWQGVEGFNAHPMRPKWAEGAPPGGAILHSILVDPRDTLKMYIAISVGGVFESSDQGSTWAPLNKGCEADYIPEKDPEYGHDPHCVRLHPLRPDRLYQQNHCGIYRMDRTGDRAMDRWERIGRNMPKKVGDIGFGVALHAMDPETVWVFPMDASTVWPRTSPGGKPAVYRTRSAGRKWERLDKGLPSEQAWFTVKRQALCSDRLDPVGIYFGTTSGELWSSRDEGESWKQIARHLPEIYSVEAAEAG